MESLVYIIWNLNPQIFPNGLMGWELPVVWYGVLFALGFLIGQQILLYIYRKEGKPEQDIETLTVYMIVATVIGARLGHVLFYEPDRYLSNPEEILMIWKGGLASHGAAFGILAALWIYSKYNIRFKGLKPYAKRITRPGQNFLQVVDRIVIVVALAGCLIRIGNFTNSEIEGIPTYSDNGIVFTRNISDYVQSSSKVIEDIDFKKGDHAVPEKYVPVTMQIEFDPQYQLDKSQISAYAEGNLSNILKSEAYFISGHIHQPLEKELDYEINEEGQVLEIYLNGIARHPAQLYEAATSFLIFILLFFLWKRKKEFTPPGLLLGLFLIILFGLRFFHEFLKEDQVAFEEQMTLNMGQILSIPLVLIGFGILLYAWRYKVTKTTTHD
ncbi:MAG: prolipoprotein diacylglyceryl transferase [Candidatus Cyclobacteriaceae bacterium M2_1C_046]